MSRAAGPVRIRAMVENDLDRVVAIAALLPTAPQWARSAYEVAIAPDGSLDGPLRRIALVAEVGGVVAGFAVASVVTLQAELESIAVAREFQRLGIGAALLAALVGQLRLVEVEELDLEVRESNREAAALYARVGFLEVGRRRKYYREPIEDAVFLRLALRSDTELEIL